ncbi:polyubiquitin 11-like protein [Tanacetum coccineum]|uniref:Polyubiquitin 11-like protein n=1 Tax=Tanacetum coccineum TaxID=301880 RepID=A0ABQ5FK05_9ASTR
MGKTTGLEVKSSNTKVMKAMIDDKDGIPLHDLAGSLMESMSMMTSSMMTIPLLNAVSRMRTPASSSSILVFTFPIVSKSLTSRVMVLPSTMLTNICINPLYVASRRSRVDPFLIWHSTRLKTQKKEGIPSYHQKLFFTEEQLVDNFTLDDYYIHNNYVLHLVLKSKKWLKIFIKTVTGKTTGLEVESFDTINNVM